VSAALRVARDALGAVCVIEEAPKSLPALRSPAMSAAWGISIESFSLASSHPFRIDGGPMVGNDESGDVAKPTALVGTHVQARHLEGIMVPVDRQTAGRQCGGKHVRV
jgi:hypothetical protein